jgi:ribosomal-protein-alanine N-acetyltransferase
VLYRPYIPQDSPTLYAIEEACFQPPHRFSRSYMRQIVRQPRVATWIAERDTRMLGFAIVEWGRELENRFAYIQTLEVLPEARGLGIGAELLRRLEDSARNAASHAIWLHVDAKNSAAMRLYQKHGYQLGGREQDYYGHNRPGLVYAKSL